MVSITAVSGAQAKRGSVAEWHQAREIIMHTPGQELLYGVICPAAGLFERSFSIDEARAEHMNYIRVLEGRGIKVHTVVGTLLAGCVDKQGNRIEGEAWEALKALTKRSIIVSGSTEVKQLSLDLASLSPQDCIRLILQRPSLLLQPTETNTGYSAQYQVDPLMNLYFCRDQMITTDKGIVLARMNSPQREAEVELMKFVLTKLGIKPIYEIQGEGRLEGGDFIPAGDTAFIGETLRTNRQAILQLMESDSFGYRRVVVVKDKWLNQQQMHLDTFFNIASEQICMLDGPRMTDDRNDQMYLEVDVYEQDPNGDRYKLISSNIPFVHYLSEVLGMRIVCVDHSDQLKYGVNFLTTSSGNIVAADGISEKLKEQMRQAGINAEWIPLKNLTGGYGSAHCMTQVISRD